MTTFIGKIMLNIMNKTTGIVIIKLLLVEDNVHLEYTLICDTKEMCFLSIFEAGESVTGFNKVR